MEIRYQQKLCNFITMHFFQKFRTPLHSEPGTPLLNVATKANSTRCFLQQNLSTFSSYQKLKSYKTYVRPIVEYA